MPEFTSRWLAPEPLETSNQRTDKTDRIGIVDFVGAPEEEIWHVFPVTAAIAERAAADTVVMVTARNIVALTLADREQYRAELDAAPADDPHQAHDRTALGIAEQMLAGAWPDT